MQLETPINVFDPIRVLLVEGDPDHAFLVSKHLAEGWPNARIDIVRSLTEANGRIATTHFDCILTGHKLRDGHATDLINTLNSGKHLLIPTIVLTTLDDDQISQEAVRMGAQDYLLKTELSPPLLARTIQHGIERQRIRQKLEDAESRLNHVSITDSLTELNNRRGIEHALTMLENHPSSLHAALLIDCDNFKMLNENHGYLGGDQVLRDVARKMTEVVRSEDITGRLGGDEFVIILANTTRSAARDIAERLRTRIQQGLEVDGDLIRYSISVGLTFFDGASKLDLDRIVAESQSTLKQGKSLGKNAVFVGAAPGTGDEPNQSLLEDAASGHTVAVPVVDMGSSKPIAMELLTHVRTHSATNVDELFAQARRVGCLAEVDRMCFVRCLRDGVKLKSPIHINVYPETLAELSPDSPEVREAIRFGLTLDVSADFLCDDPARMCEVLRPWRDAKARIALDDVGLNLAHLEALILIQPNFAKVDGRWVSQAHVDRRKAQVLHRLVDVCQVLNIQLVAEGVSEVAEIQWLQKRHFSYAQGQYFGAPFELTPRLPPKPKAQLASVISIN